jgi:alkylated DNA repair dioxygenase AlkB
MRGAPRQDDLFAAATALPDGLRYVEGFISAAEEAALLAEIERLPFANARYKEWTANRRVVSYGGRYDFSINELLAEGMRLRRYPHVARRGGRSLALELAPRSVYSLRGEARWGWQHAISPTPGLRYSITFRTLRGAGAPASTQSAGFAAPASS